MITIWPLKTAEMPGLKPDDCVYLIQNYDLSGGLSAIADAGQQGQPFDGRGPFLVGWSPAKSRGQKDAVVLIVDMSGLESQKRFDEALLSWQNKIVEDPLLWRNGSSIERVRLAVRDFVDHYGKNILDAIHLSVGKGGRIV